MNDQTIHEEDFFPSIPPESLRLGNTYRVGFLSPFVGSIALQERTRSGWRINPVFFYSRGFPISPGLITAASVNGSPFNLPNTNVTNSAHAEEIYPAWSPDGRYLAAGARGCLDLAGELLDASLLQAVEVAGGRLSQERARPAEGASLHARSGSGQASIDPPGRLGGFLFEGGQCRRFFSAWAPCAGCPQTSSAATVPGCG